METESSKLRTLIKKVVKKQKKRKQQIKAKKKFNSFQRLHQEITRLMQVNTNTETILKLLLIKKIINLKINNNTK